MSCSDCTSGCESYKENNLNKSLGSYSNYINRKKAIENLKTITDCKYAKNYNFNIQNNRIIYSNNYESLNQLKFYIGNLNCRKSTNELPYTFTTNPI
jgi:hypothetical protein